MVDLVRIYVGLVLFAKGVYFMSSREILLATVQVDMGIYDANAALFAHAIVLTHTVGGLMLAFGFLTRLAAAAQVPVILGAILYVHLPEGMFSRDQSLEFTCLLLFLLVLYAVFGAGGLSVDDPVSPEEG